MKSKRVGVRGTAKLLAALVCFSPLYAIAASPDAPNAVISKSAPPGQDAYVNHCASCHGPSLGGGFGPPLMGDGFVARWGQAAPDALLNYVKKMPPSDPNSLDPATYAEITNFIRTANQLPAAGAAAAASAAPTPKRPSAHIVPPIARNYDAAYTAARQHRDDLANRVTPVTDAMQRAPRDEDWLLWRRDQASHGFSPLHQIDRSSVGQLRLAWSLALSHSTNAITPLVHDGVMYIDSNGTVQALDAASGDVIWEYARPSSTTRVPLSQPRGIALYGNAVYVPTIDNHELALDAHTGKLLWDHELAQPDDRLETTAAPLIVHGKVIQGVSGCQGQEYRGGCFIVALDAATGKELWRFHTIARGNQPGADSWNGAPTDERFGGSVWTAGSYDPELNLVYFGTGQTYKISTLLRANARPGRSKDALFTNTTLALNPDTGKLVWYYQHFAGDVWDLDWAFEQTLLSLPTPQGPRKAVATIGKLGIIDVVDAKTGHYLWSHDLGLQNLVTAIDPKTGHKTFDPALVPEVDHPKLVCPSGLGVRNWLATSYDPDKGNLYVPMVANCMNIAFKKDEVGEFDLATIVPPNSDGNFGRVAAFNLKTQKTAWTDEHRAAEASALLATAGGLVFEGTLDHWFRALDSDSGETLWQARLDDSPHSYPISFMADGVQYVAVVTGGGTPHDIIFRNFTPEFIHTNRGKTLWVFSLPQHGGTAH